MTLQDFLAASTGDERLAWARFLFWQGSKTNQKEKIRHAPSWDNLCLIAHPDHLGNNENLIEGCDYLTQADAVLAELARQRTDAWHKGHAEGVKSMTTI